MSTEKRITDFSYLDTISDGDPAFKREMIETYLGSTPSIISDMQEALKNRQWKNLGDLAHSMKPSFMLFGFESQKEIVLKIEEFGRQGEQINQLPSLFNELKKIVEQVMDELQKELEKL